MLPTLKKTVADTLYLKRAKQVFDDSLNVESYDALKMKAIWSYYSAAMIASFLKNVIMLFTEL